MTSKEKKLAAYLLNMAADSYANHGCNDLDEGVKAAAGFTQEEEDTFCREYREWNNRDDPNDPHPDKFRQMMDCAVMAFLAHKLETE